MAECVKTYATAASRTYNEDKRELVMDEAEAEEMSGEETKDTPPEPTPTKQVKDHHTAPKEDPSTENNQLEAAHASQADDVGKGQRDATTTGAVSTTEEPEPMDNQESGASNTTAKRQREGNNGDGVSTEVTVPDEPPPKSAPGRRSSFKPKPTIPPDRRTASTPWATKPP